MLRTTPATFTAFLQTIPWDTIPPSFQDAISFARKLALPFLWIDALCIIQDDAKDWQQQSSAMADIYQGAYLTLAATSSPNAGGGCYTQMHTSPAHRSTSPLLTIHSANSTRCLSARPKFTHKMSRLPLLTRAWVYQERILSPRVLHFADEELVWECQHAVTCECSGDNLEDRMEHARISLSNSFGLIGPHRRHPAPLDLWFQIVDEYTSLRLKFASDMLPALSGIAKAFAERCGGGYVAGMWRRTLVREMLWYRQEVDGSEIYRGEVRPWRAPSWSWVSRDWPADFRVLPTTREIAQVLDVSCQPAGADPTGQLESATLTLRTKVLRARFEIGSRTIDLFSGDLKIPQAVFQETSYILSELCTGYLDFDEQYQPDILLAQIAECSGDCRMFLAGLPAPVHVTQEVLSFMLLARREEREEGWRRVGLATIAAYEPDSSSFACLTSEERCKIIGDKRKCERPRVSDESAEWKRALFQRLNDSEMQDLLVW
ncbi:hypothetical protein HBI56_185760 [Parastagonospora nodorum]|uniref:Heterokaryon incompatibility domain-containing protein n=1 Tax=Phaeosphaeria nodorum (strain SN15 / ATCC MYA-4574 / FGSC 10173) TaxID=321614 RepID=A0A7U2NQB6_PHANO|nr:hypothetical protein HBH56_163820 [Parastagonospora nodorum]QRD06524.1 hypothetical protein JI435_118900 [Parastagonospora nodorum SN15]KAH3932172.1 hypothetical protein HBH54_085420 [Parastagonospora nodorum]KAH3972681.1 hypothetical protein HBH51_099960 [Parastagonospora nodorum]KAH4141465.1 hypothetical protein HBH45_072600 [Parastagonospora nodorum]